MSTYRLYVCLIQIDEDVQTRRRVRTGRDGRKKRCEGWLKIVRG